MQCGESNETYQKFQDFTGSDTFTIEELFGPSLDDLICTVLGNLNEPLVKE